MGSDRIVSMAPDDVGDWNAPAGSEPWCTALRLSLQNVVKSIGTVPEKVRDYVERAIAHRAWTHWKGSDGVTFVSFEAFCAARPPYGLGRSFAEIRPYIEAVKGPVVTSAITAAKLDEHGGKRAGAGRPSAVEAVVEATEAKTNQASHQKLDKKRRSFGETSDYLSARIARDAPAVHAKMLAGEYPSVRAAAREAGLVNDPDPVKVAARALKKVPRERMAELTISGDVRGVQMQIRRLTGEEQEQVFAWLGKELGRPT